MLEINGHNVFFNEFIPRDRFLKDAENKIIMNPYSGGCLILGLGKTYKDVFKAVGISSDSIDSCMDHAKRKIKDYINISY
jgi:hypothetical protein